MNQNKKTFQKSTKTRSRGRGKQKEVELNVDLSKVNKADLPHILPAGERDNDYSWYRNIANLIDNYASLPFSLPSGLPLDLLRRNDVKTTNNSTTEAGIMVLDIVPAIGRAQSPTDPVNLAAQQIYTLDRKANSGATNYDSTDVMLVIVAMLSAYMLYEEMVRGYKSVAKYETQNRYFPDVVSRSLGFDHEFLMRNYKDIKGFLDVFANQLGAINVPDQFDIIKRQSWLFSNVYTDAENVKSQLYAFRPAGFYVWTEGQNSEPTSLKYTTRNDLYGLDGTGIVTSMDQLWNAMNTIMQPILGSQDVGTISGDLAKAFGDNGMVKVNLVTEGDVLTPAYSKEVLTEIENAMIFPAGANDITVVNTNLVSGPYLTQSPPVLETGGTAQLDSTTMTAVRPIINMHWDNVTSDDVAVATRFVYDVTPAESTTGTKVTIKSYGTEWVRAARIYFFNGSTAAGLDYSTYTGYTQNLFDVSQGTNINAGLATRIKYTQLWSQFDWAPIMQTWINIATGDTKDWYFAGYMCDWDNVQVLTEQTINDINYAAVLSLFKVKDFH